jgi:plastocyanin
MNWKRAPLLLALVSFSALAQEMVEISIENYKFEPAEVNIRPGGKVRWINREKRTSHSVVLGGQESERLFPGDAWEKGFAQAGIYFYTCGPHPEMKGIINVSE